VAASAVASFLALGTGPQPALPHDIGGLHVEMAVEATITKERRTSVAPFAFPFWMINPA